jgi:hypothetical protein
MQDAEIKLLMKHLEETINETLAESPKIDERIQEIRDAGYEIFLAIEAKVRFGRKEGDAGEEIESQTSASVKLRITQEDAKFLKTLKISAE